MFYHNQISDLTPLSNWKTDNVTNMNSMFQYNQISNLTPLSNWKTDKVTDMSNMFDSNPIKYANLSNWTFGKLVLNTLVNSYYYYGPLYSFLPNTTIYLGNSALPDGYYQTNINHVKNNSPFNSIADHNLILTTNQEYLHTDVAQNAHNYLTFTENGQATKVAMPVWVNATGVTADKASILNKVKSLVDTEITKKQQTLGNNYKITMDPNVDQTDPISLINANFIIVPITASIIVHFEDIDPNADKDDDTVKQELAKIVELSGNKGNTVDLSQIQLPTNFELSGDLPSATFGETDSVTINLKHKTETSVESLPATRTINVHLPNGTTKVYRQVIGYQRDAITDLVTKKVTRGTWTVNDVTSSFTIDGVKQLEHSYVLKNGNYSYASIKLPKIPGYKAKVSRNNGLLLVSYLALAPEKPVVNTNLNDQFSNNLAVNSTVKSDLIVKSDMYQVVNDNHNWQLPVIKNYELKFATNKNQIIFAYTKDKQNDYRFVLTFKDGQYRLATFDKEDKLLKTYSIKSYDELAKIVYSLVLMNIA